MTEARRMETLDERIVRVQSSPHHPSNCFLKASFGRDCDKCDPAVAADNKLRYVERKRRK